MILIDNALRRALTKLADSFNPAQGNWRHSSRELKAVAVALNGRIWNRELKSALARSIQRRINRRHFPMAFGVNSRLCTQHIAENAVANIRRYMLKGINGATAAEHRRLNGFTYLQDHVN